MNTITSNHYIAAMPLNIDMSAQIGLIHARLNSGKLACGSQVSCCCWQIWLSREKEVTCRHCLKVIKGL